jgi:hypothetical protein
VLPFRDNARNIIEAEPTVDSFKLLREALVASHAMTEFQKVDHIVNMEGLNGRKPSEFLAAMTKVRPAEDKDFFAYHFLQSLPCEVRVLLSCESVDNMQALAEKAEKADSFMALHRPQQHDVAAVATTAEDGDEESSIAAIKKSSGKQQPNKQKRQRSRSSSLERSSPLCWLHICFGDKARRCEQPCTWPAQQEN